MFSRSRRGVWGWGGFSTASMRCVSVIWDSTPRRSRRPCAVRCSRTGCWRRPCGGPTCRRRRFTGGCFAGGGAGGNTGWSMTSPCRRPFSVRHGPMQWRAWRAVESGCMGRRAVGWNSGHEISCVRPFYPAVPASVLAGDLPFSCGMVPGQKQASRLQQCRRLAFNLSG